MSLFGVLYWIWVVSEVAILLLTRTRAKAGRVEDRGSLLLLWVVIVGSLVVSGWIAATHRPTIPGGALQVKALSSALLTSGLAVRWAAIASLGRSFSANVAIRPEQALHQTGFFRFVRHPSYSGLLLIFAAIGVHTRIWAALLVMLVPMAAALLYRIHVEEATLRGAFGEAYERYSKRSKRLIPGVY